MSFPTVHVIDDDESFLLSATRLFRASGLTVKAFVSADDFLERMSRDARGCVVSDLRMPGMNGLELQEVMKRDGHVLPVVFLTGEGDIPSTVTAMRHGAVDFLEKDAPKEVLLDAIHRALARDEAEESVRSRHQQVRDRFACLSAREREVLAHVVRGCMNKEIAAELGIHERTVKLHRTAVTSKLGVQSVAELTRLWLEASA